MAVKWFKLIDRKPKHDQLCWITGVGDEIGCRVIIGPLPYSDMEDAFIDPEENDSGSHNTYDAGNGVTHWCAQADISGPPEEAKEAA